MEDEITSKEDESSKKSLRMPLKKHQKEAESSMSEESSSEAAEMNCKKLFQRVNLQKANLQE